MEVGRRVNSKTPCRFRELFNIHPYGEDAGYVLSVRRGFALFLVFHRYNIEAEAMLQISAADQEDGGGGRKAVQLLMLVNIAADFPLVSQTT